MSYRAILVYDVSRWGRFQDTDESAYYEFICKQAGIQVIYCAEQFENDGSPTATIIKSVSDTTQTMAVAVRMNGLRSVATFIEAATLMLRPS